ncbi:AAA family ATPase [Leisingera aquaemixtae]|uniref:AAA family ATPase n=1 Tax=Leisingera aquaemixtae TaxID=1396826 RepID=UPI0021A5F9C2|nr:AAA family ATPase [Leisingera aquaemixtae]
MEDIPNFAVLVGANGTGKSTLIDVFGFLKDCLIHNVRSAVQKRAGFKQLVSRGFETEAIEIELKVQLDFEQEQKSRTVTYVLHVSEDRGKAIVAREVLKFRRRGNKGQPFHFIDVSRGEGIAVAETTDSFDAVVDHSSLDREEVSLDSPDILAIKALGQFRRFEAASQLRELIEGWTVSDFHIEDARIEPDAAPAEHLNEKGDNLALYAQYLSEHYPDEFEELLEKMAERVPGVSKVDPEDSGDGRVLLRFNDTAFSKGFIARAVSDGTIKMFAYLALLADPDPHPLLCIEEPENQLYPTLLPLLAEEFAEYAHRRTAGAQVFVTTHSPDFLSSVDLDAIYWLRKENGFSTISKASQNKTLKNLFEKGEKPGWLWRQGWFEGADPN